MPDSIKIATCSFCGLRAVLKLRELTGHHELACAGCAAPLGEMKPMKISSRSPARRTGVKPTPSYTPYNKKKKPSRKRKPLSDIFEDFFEDIWDEIEDIFD
ncbi:hypothetical protein GCM10007939_17220 [Amylibacter marinus]|uniref:Uncharacterized protein n=1 Tax=Amylibacter marinus TaxID=1475483 RepID=A0ABQ5VVW3_9RHOB|nr:hypothetical protein [Amylibacter marinus]GLQ35439.1 hypothetical protein GCM10007939_17220 [Amylibacter marinus]